MQAIGPGDVPVKNLGKPEFPNGQQNGHIGVYLARSIAEWFSWIHIIVMWTYSGLVTQVRSGTPKEALHCAL